MDYSKVTFAEYQTKKKAIFDSLGREEDICDGVICNECPFSNSTYCCSEHTELENPIEAIKLVMDYEIPANRSKVKIDTPIWVRDYDTENWRKRHFAKYENGLVWTFNNGFTSWTGKQNNINSWDYARLAESEEINNEK